MLFKKKNKTHKIDSQSVSGPSVQVVPTNDIKTTNLNNNKVTALSLITPVITEKATALENLCKYVFEVEPHATKNEIKKAIKELYGFRPINVRVMNMGGKNVRYGKTTGITKSRRKAIVTLKKGDKINFTTTK